MRNVTNEQIKDFIRHQFAWPGCYPKMLVMNDGEALCHTCAKNNAKQILRDTRLKDRYSGWTAAGVDINWESTGLYCGHCNATIESAYGAPS